MAKAASNPALSNVTFAVSWHPFFLDRSLPVEGVNKKMHYERKFGGGPRVQQMQERLKSIGLEEGIRFAYPDDALLGNSFDSHRLIHHAGTKSPEAQNATSESIMRAYFEEAKLISDHGVLLDAVRGIPGMEDAADVLSDSDRYRSIVDQQVQMNYARGISGVPHFIINDKYGLGGAQDVDTWVNVMEQVVAKEAAGQ